MENSLDIISLLLYITGTASVITACIVLFLDRTKLSNIYFSVMSLSLGGWAVGIAQFRTVDTLDSALLWAIIFYIFPLGVSVGSSMFAKTFPKSKKTDFQVFVPLLASAILIGLLLTSGHFLAESVVEREWGRELLFNKFHYALYSLFIVPTLGYPLIKFYQLKSSLSGLYRAQAKMLFYGWSVTSIFGVFFNLILPWFGNYRLIWVGPLFTSAVIFATAYSIVKHKMFDTRAFIIRSLGYILALALITVIYSAGSYVIADKFFDSESSAAQAATVALFFIGAIFYQPTKVFFQRLTNKIFFRDSYDAQVLIDELNQLLVSDVEIESLLKKTADLISRNIKTSHCGFYVRETAYFPSRYVSNKKKTIPTTDLERIRQLSPEVRYRIHLASTEPGNNEERILKEIMQKNDIEVLGRLVSTLKYEVEGVGYLIVGPKQSGAVYSEQDLKVLEIITNELVLAVENALRLEEIEQFNVTLQKKIDGATKELKDSNEKLKALDEAKDEFVSMASHQLRTPLTSIKGYLSMVIEGDAGKITPTQKDMLGQAFFSSQRMVYLISDLLNVSRLKTGKFLIEPKPVYLPDVVQSEIEQLRDGAKAKNIKLSFAKPDKFSKLMLDEMKIRQVVMNFIDNAIYYTPQNGTIAVALKETSKSVEMTVTDSGMGVPKDQQHKLFTKFYRADNARKARPDGTGLGLFMAKKVVIAQGGSMIFKSKENKGSTFGFSFPKEKLLVKEPEKPKKTN